MSAHLYSLDIGFDREALPRPGSDSADSTDSIYPLQFGITRVNDLEANPVAQARDLKMGGSILFTLYDLTREEQDASDCLVKELSFRISFQRARQSTANSSPTSSDCYQEFSIHPGKLAPGRSTVFAAKGNEAKYQNWNVFPCEEGSGRLFPKNQLQCEEAYPPAEGVALLHDGCFYFVMELHVAWKEKGSERCEKHYRTDPEMILSPNGLDPDDDDPGGDQGSGD